MASLTLNDLPRFSPWPARLLGLEPWTRRLKTPVEVTREFEHEKWGPLLENVRAAKTPATLQEVNEWMLNDAPPSLCSINERLELISAMDAYRRYLEMVKCALDQHGPASALVELGAGYGAVLLGLAQMEPYTRMRIMAGEFSAAGVELLRRLAAAQGIAIAADHCDLASPGITALTIPPDSIIFTSYAAHYSPKLPAAFVERLSALQPRAVVHFEPCYEHCERDTLIGLMRRRYIEVNDYNTNLITLLREHHERGLIKIIEERPAGFGSNPLLPASVLAWAPRQAD